MPALAQIVIAIYFLALLGAAFIRPWQSRTHSDFILAGRKLTLFPFVATLVSTMYGWIVGIGELYYQYGISAWLFLSLPYSLFSLVFALFYARKARQGEFNTLPDLVAHHYGRRPANIASVLILVLSSPAMYLLMTAQVLHFAWGLDMTICIVASTVFSGIYILQGGFKTVVKTDLLQFVLMFAGFVVIVTSLYMQYGLAPLQKLDADKLHFSAPYSPWYIISWFLLAAVVLVDPNYHQRIYAVDKPSTAQKGLVISVLCWTFFDFLTATAALYALSLLPPISDLSQIYLLLGSQVLSPLWLGIFFTGLLATIISTSNSFLFTSALTFSKDLLHRNNLFLRFSIESLTRWALLIMALLNALICIAYRNESVVTLFFDCMPYVCAGLLVPVLFSYTRFKLKGNRVFVQMLLSLLVTFLIKLFKTQKLDAGLPDDLNEVYFGLGFSLLFHLVATLFTRNETETHTHGKHSR